MAGRTFTGGVWTDIGGPLVFASGKYTNFNGPLVFTSGGWNSPTPVGYELEIDFTTKSAGAMPSTFDTGQSLRTTWDTISASNPVLSNPGAGVRYTIAATDASAQAGYITPTTALTHGDVTYMEATWAYPTAVATTAGSIVLVSWDRALPSGSLTGGGLTDLNAPCHAVFDADGWHFAAFDYPTGEIAIGGRYDYASGYHDTVARTASVLIDKAANTVHITGWDGVTVSRTASQIGSISGVYPCCEIYYNNASSERRPGGLSFKASSA